MAIILEFRSRAIRPKADRPGDAPAAASLPADVIVFPRVSLIHLRSIAQAMRTGPSDDA